MLKGTSAGTPLPLAGEKTPDYGTLPSVASSGFIGSRQAQTCSGGSPVTFSFISQKLVEKHN